MTSLFGEISVNMALLFVDDEAATVNTRGPRIYLSRLDTTREDCHHVGVFLNVATYL